MASQLPVLQRETVAWADGGSHEVICGCVCAEAVGADNEVLSEFPENTYGENLKEERLCEFQYDSAAQLFPAGDAAAGAVECSEYQQAWELAIFAFLLPVLDVERMPTHLMNHIYF